MQTHAQVFSSELHNSFLSPINFPSIVCSVWLNLSSKPLHCIMETMHSRREAESDRKYYHADNGIYNFYKENVQYLGMIWCSDPTFNAKELRQTGVQFTIKLSTLIGKNNLPSS